MPDKKRDRELTRPGVRSDAYEREATTDLKDQTPDRPKGMPLHTRILIGLLIGVVAGVAANYAVGGADARVAWVIANITEPIGALFLRLLLMVVVPLVFSSLVVGVAGIGDVRKLGRVGLKSFAYTLVISAISVVIGLTLANTIRPGKRLSAETRAGLEARYGAEATKSVTAATQGGPGESALMQVVKIIVPSNPVASVAGIIAGAEKQTRRTCST
jgi:DAACS family dicarboxylate/amino acid:cation (Na+ or H+) symporter